MASSSSIELVQRLLKAINDKDEAGIAEAYTEEASVRTAGVPRAFGGVVEGREAILENLGRQPPTSLDVRLVFGDDTHVCVVAKREGIVPTTQTLRGSDQPFTTYACLVFHIEDDKVKEQTNYVNWLDAYTQAGLIDLGSLLA